MKSAFKKQTIPISRGKNSQPKVVRLSSTVKARDEKAAGLDLRVACLVHPLNFLPVRSELLKVQGKFLGH